MFAPSFSASACKTDCDIQTGYCGQEKEKPGITPNLNIISPYAHIESDMPEEVDAELATENLSDNGLLQIFNRFLFGSDLPVEAVMEE